jgi:hypothetical protein
MYRETLLGKCGDLGIASPRKSFPILNGGILFLKGEAKPPAFDFPLEPVNIFKPILRDLAGRVLDYFPLIKRVILRKEDHSESNADIKDWSIDKISHDLLLKYDLHEVRKIRTSIYRIWERWCKTNKLNPVFSSIDDSYAPLAMPLLFENKNTRDEWLKRFEKNHIAAYTWPDLPDEIADTPNSGRSLQENILCLPIHLAMQQEKLEKFLSNKFIY